MSLLSITFHATETAINEWEVYLENDLHQIIENLMEVEKYLLSEVQSDLINDGKNTNLLLFFQDEEKREEFVEIELTNISERIEQTFGGNVMIFKTYLNPKKMRFELK
jgi:hypothetical protein